MMAKGERFPYLDATPGKKPSILMPFLPLTLLRGRRAVEVMGLLDTGAATNALPYDVGLKLGAKWEEQDLKLSLTGNLASVEARALFVSARIARFPAVELAFAWAKSDAFPVILGQTNFFMEFDVSVYRSQAVFEVRPARRKSRKIGRH
jgi:hypothetical protein